MWEDTVVPWSSGKVARELEGNGGARLRGSRMQEQRETSWRKTVQEKLQFKDYKTDMDTGRVEVLNVHPCEQENVCGRTLSKPGRSDNRDKRHLGTFITSLQYGQRSARSRILCIAGYTQARQQETR